jgi:hypothetical protein
VSFIALPLRPDDFSRLNDGFGDAYSSDYCSYDSS